MQAPMQHVASKMPPERVRRAHNAKTVGCWVQKTHNHTNKQICRCICLYTMLFGCSARQTNSKQTKITKLLLLSFAGRCAVRFEVWQRFVFVECMRHIPLKGGRPLHDTFV